MFRSPRWLLSHLLVLAVVVGFVSLGFWQLRRLDERREQNALVADRTAARPVEVEDLPSDPDALRFVPVVARGRYGDALEAVRANQDGVGGFRLFRVLDGDGYDVVVLQGFGPADAPAPEGEVEVEGVALPVARLDHPSRIAVDRLREAVPRAPALVVLASRTDAPLVPVPLPDQTEGPHLSYAVQWFVFATVAAVGYPLYLRREAARRRA